MVQSVPMRSTVLPWLLAPLALAAQAPDPAPEQAPEPGTVRLDARGVAQVWVPAGSFVMGTGDQVPVEPPAWAARELASERPPHAVEITQGFWLDRTEVTIRSFAAFAADGGYGRRELWSQAGWAWLAARGAEELPLECLAEATPDMPRVCVTWYEAEAYAAWRGGRLPREAEWEWAARGPESRLFPWGDAWDPELAQVEGAGGPAPVGSFPDGASWVGALDMAGNAMEWVQDWLDVDYYARGEKVDPAGPAQPTAGARKVEKGGWWGGPPFAARAAYRHFEDPPEYQDHHIGLRVLSAPGTPAGAGQ